MYSIYCNRSNRCCVAVHAKTYIICLPRLRLRASSRQISQREIPMGDFSFLITTSGKYIQTRIQTSSVLLQDQLRKTTWRCTGNCKNWSMVHRIDSHPMTVNATSNMIFVAVCGTSTANRTTCCSTTWIPSHSCRLPGNLPFLKCVPRYIFTTYATSGYR